MGAAHSKRWSKYAIFMFLTTKSLKKQEICSKILQKHVFLSLHQNAVYNPKNCFLFFWKKRSTSVLVQTQKTCFFRLILHQIFAFFKLYSTKTAENDYFGQRGVRSTQMLVEIYNTQFFCQITFISFSF